MSRKPKNIVRLPCQPTLKLDKLQLKRLQARAKYLGLCPEIVFQTGINAWLNILEGENCLSFPVRLTTDLDFEGQNQV